MVFFFQPYNTYNQQHGRHQEGRKEAIKQASGNEGNQDSAAMETDVAYV